jgi:hypothetical protein
MRKHATVVAADAWLDKVIHQSPAFQAQVDEEFAAIDVAQDFAALRESRQRSGGKTKKPAAVRSPA